MSSDPKECREQATLCHLGPDADLSTNLSAFFVGSTLPGCRCLTVTPQQGAPIDEQYP